MITLEQFKNMSDLEKCDLINKQLAKYNTKTFKNGDISFTWGQVVKALENTSITKVDGKYMTADQVSEYMKNKEEKQKSKEITEEEVLKIKQLLEDETFEKLLKLAEKYNYVSSYILKADTGIKIAEMSGDVKTTSVRVYAETLAKWQEFTAKNKQYTALDLLNTALIEYMERY